MRSRMIPIAKNFSRPQHYPRVEPPFVIFQIDIGRTKSCMLADKLTTHSQLNENGTADSGVNLPKTRLYRNSAFQPRRREGKVGIAPDVGGVIRPVDVEDGKGFCFASYFVSRSGATGVSFSLFPQPMACTRSCVCLVAAASSFSACSSGFRICLISPIPA
jgi:hypothetical protein